jgi:hypothetical protein
MRATFSKRLGERIPLPPLPNTSETCSGNEDLDGLVELLRGWPEVENMPQAAMLDILDTYSLGEIASAFSVLGWKAPAIS